MGCSRTCFTGTLTRCLACWGDELKPRTEPCPKREKHKLTASLRLDKATRSARGATAFQFRNNGGSYLTRVIRLWVKRGDYWESTGIVLVLPEDHEDEVAITKMLLSQKIAHIRAHGG